jgi:hypothetical protein
VLASLERRGDQHLVEDGNNPTLIAAA